MEDREAAVGLLPVSVLHRLIVAARAEETGRVAPRPVAPVLGTVTGEGVAVVGASGGSGETYLAAALALVGVPAWATDHRRPTQPGAVVVTTRSTAGHLAATQRLLHRWKDEPTVPGQALLGVVVLADAPMRPSRDIAATIATIASVVPTVWHISFQPAWRERLPGDLDIDKALLAQLSPIADATAAATDEKENNES